MRHLLQAGAHRLIRNRIFWLELTAVIFMAVLLCLCNVRPHSGEPQYLDYAFFSMTAYNPIFYAAGVSLLLGTEYSYGTLRSKLAAGYPRAQVFLSQISIAVLSTVLATLVQYAVAAVLGTALYDGFKVPGYLAGMAVLFGLLSGISIACICGSITLCCQHHGLSSALSILGFLVLLWFTAQISGRLLEPETIRPLMETAIGYIQYGEPVPNPDYVSGPLRSVLEFLNDFLPTGPICQIFNQDFPHPLRCAAFSLGFIGLTCGLGFARFRTLDFK